MRVWRCMSVHKTMGIYCLAQKWVSINKYNYVPICMDLLRKTMVVFNNYTLFCFYLRQITIVQSSVLIE